MEPLKKYLLRPLSWLLLMAVLAPIILPFLLIEMGSIIGRHVFMPIYYFAKYRDRLMQVVYRAQFDQQAIEYQGSLEQLNDMDLMRGGIPSSKLDAYNERFTEIKKENQPDR